MRKFLFLMLCGMTQLAVSAQDETGQILVFRNTGEVNLLYAQEVDSIVFSAYDKDSVLHDDFVSQVFYAQDTTLVVPVAEIDSVAFGNRNAAVFQPQGRALTADDLAYIVRYDGNNIYYAGHTPVHMLPQAGDKLFYGGMTELFPEALCVKVNSVSSDGANTVANVSPIPLEEMFSQLFFAGTVSYTPTVAKRSTHQIRQDIPVGGQGKISVGGTIQLDTRFVVSPLTSYYYANVSIKTELGMESDLSFTDVEPFHYESDKFLDIPFSPVLGVLYPSCGLQTFADIEAELAFKYSMTRKMDNRWEWTRKDGENSFKQLGGNGDGATDEAQMDIICKGEVFFGLQPVFQFSLPFEAAGARAKVKVGPSFSGELGLGLLQSLQEYQPELYLKGELDAALKVGLTGSVFHRRFGFGEESETVVYQQAFNVWEKKIPLFPDFKASRAVRVEQPQEKILSLSTKTETPLIRELEAGFEIVDAHEETIDSVFVEQPILANQNEPQGITAEIPFSAPESTESEEVYMRPVFHYAGHTIRAQQVPVLHDSHLQPVTAYLSNGANSFISGWPYIGSATVDSTLYHIGAYLPVHLVDTVFTRPAPLATGVYLDAAQENLLLGTWEGEVDGDVLRYTFSDEAHGSFTAESKAGTTTAFSYTLNTPQSGDIRLAFAAPAPTASILTVVMIGSESMRIKFKGDSETYLFTKIQD